MCGEEQHNDTRQHLHGQLTGPALNDAGAMCAKEAASNRQLGGSSSAFGRPHLSSYDRKLLLARRHLHNARALKRVKPNGSNLESLPRATSTNSRQCIFISQISTSQRRGMEKLVLLEFSSFCTSPYFAARTSSNYLKHKIAHFLIHVNDDTSE